MYHDMTTQDFCCELNVNCVLINIVRASLLLHEYDESAICFNQLHDKQQAELTALLHRRNACVEASNASTEEKDEVSKDTGVSLEDLEKQIEELKANIETTNGWLRKVEKGKRAYKVSQLSYRMQTCIQESPAPLDVMQDREKVMASKIARGLFGEPKPAGHSAGTNAPVTANHVTSGTPTPTGDVIISHIFYQFFCLNCTRR